MGLVIFSDPHIGVNRTKNTTPASRELLRKNILSTVCGMANYTGHRACAGDLFDTYSNSEHIISDGSGVIDFTDLTLAGNHDIVPDADKKGSLQLLAEHHTDGRIALARFNEVVVNSRMMGNHFVVSVPHHTTQDLFEKALSQAWIEAEAAPPCKKKILITHCNYELSFEKNETTLNLEHGRAVDLLTAFDYVLCGHEHAPRELLDDRLIIIGCPYPTGFADISDKRIILIDDEGELTEQPTWSAATGYAVYEYDAIPEATAAEFVRVIGQPEPGSLAQLARDIRKLWKSNPQLIGVKLDTEVQSLGSVQSRQSESLVTLPALVAKELASRPDLKALWEEFST